jgi:hypothetical protein
MKSKEVFFGLHGDGLNSNGREVSRGEIQGYHQKPNPVLINKSFKADVSGLKKVDKRNVLSESLGGFESRFTIGFEVEKNQLHRNAVKEYELFCGFERDGSCGYEAVTHILPLVGASQWRTKVFDMFHKAEKIIDDRFSPSDKRCGGHVTLSCDGMDGSELNEKVRKYSGIVLAMFRQRLKNSFCNQNISMKPRYSTSGYINGIDNKYNVALMKGKLLEFRIVSKFESVKQMMRRYEFFYELMDFAVNDGGTFAKFLTRIRPVIVMMYEGNEAKADKVLDLAVDFQALINTHVVSEKIREFMP